MSKTIAVVGVGTVGILSLSHFLTYLPDDWKVISIHDPSIPILGIGESTPVTFVSNLFHGSDWSILEAADELDATVKLGIKYVNWREHEIYSHVMPPSYAMHLNNFKIKDAFITRFKNKWKDKFQVIEVKILDIVNAKDSVDVITEGETINVDWVIDCRGWPEDYKDYYISDVGTVNHALVQMVHEPGNWNFTYHVAHEHGWQFGIPLKTRQGWGYLYNDTITSKEEAIEGATKLLEGKIDKKDISFKEFSWKNFYAVKFAEGRILKNGNRAMFLEPMEGFSGAFYIRANQVYFDYILGYKTEDEVNVNLFHSCQDVENMICYIYHGGSTFDTPFWRNVKENATHKIMNHPRFLEYIYKIKSMNRVDRIVGSFSPLSIPLWENHDKGFGYHYFTPKD